MNAQDPSEGDIPEYQFDSYAGETDDGDGLEEQLASDALSRLQDRKQNFNNFETDNLNVLDELRTPLSADDLITAIQAARFMASSTRGLIQIVQTYISTDTILANVTNKELAWLYYATAISALEYIAPKTDTSRREWFTITNNMAFAVRAILSRATGPYRERRLQDQNRAEVITGKLAQAQQKESAGKAPFKLPLGR